MVKLEKTKVEVAEQWDEIDLVAVALKMEEDDEFASQEDDWKDFYHLQLLNFKLRNTFEIHS